MWGNGEMNFFLKRPMDPYYREYCIKDVLDLPEIYDKYQQNVNKNELSFAKWISAQYSYQGYLMTQKDKIISKE